jgi:hypothetical protein
MRARWYGKSVRNRWIAVVVGIVVVGLLGYGFFRFETWRNRPSEARRLADAATVAGFVRTAVVDVNDGDDASVADAFFIGAAPKPNPLAVVAVPTIELKALDPPIVAPESGSAVVARGTRPDECAASVVFLAPPGSEPGKPDWHLTTQQLDNVRKGTQILIQLHVYNCRL